jgi:hypothetical protein
VVDGERPTLGAGENWLLPLPDAGVTPLAVHDGPKNARSGQKKKNV